MSEDRKPSAGRWNEFRVEQAIGRLLRAGVLLSALVVFAGGCLYLFHHGRELPEYRTFRGEPQQFRLLSDLLAEVRAGSGRGIVQLGLILLIATPVMRVAFAGVAFLRQGDRFYAAVAALVLAILGYALLMSS